MDDFLHLYSLLIKLDKPLIPLKIRFSRGRAKWYKDTIKYREDFHMLVASLVSKSIRDNLVSAVNSYQGAGQQGCFMAQTPTERPPEFNT
jgi:hypothetical protein